MATDQSGEERSKLLETARELYARLVTAQTAQRHQVEVWHRRATTMRWGNVVLAILTTAAIVIALTPGVPRNPAAPIAAVVLSFILLGMLLAQVGFDPGRHELEHRLAAGKLAAERGRFLVALARMAAPATPLADAQHDIERLSREAALIHGLMREPSERIYRPATVALKRGEEAALSRDEIDRLLPDALRWHPQENFRSRPFEANEQAARMPAREAPPAAAAIEDSPEIKPQTDS
jgi:hypothetical protein